MSIQSIFPATGEVLASFDDYTPAQVEEAIASAHAAFKVWSRTSFAERAACMRRAAAYLRDNKARYGKIMTLEMGKPIVEAEGEIEKCAWTCDYFAENAEHFLAPEPVQTNAVDSYIVFDPLGVILAVMPWNFPFWQVIRFAAPAVMAGNTFVLKHASNVPQSSLAIEELFRESGFPEGVARSILIPGAAVDAVLADPRIRGVSLTGSSDTGSRVASASGTVIKKAVLELGGSDPFIVLEDADIDLAAATAARARYQNTGQSCIAAKRFIVVDNIAAEFERKFVDAVNKLKTGDPLERDTNVGPMARADLLDALEKQVAASVERGAKIATGGHRLDRPGFFYAPTVVTNVTPGMPVFSEETFGPVAAVIRVKDADEAIEVANMSEYGLGSSLWTRDLDRARELARRIESGAVFVNGMVASDPRLPFGGVKNSGFGRELSAHGIREFVNVKSVWLGPAVGPQMPAK